VCNTHSYIYIQFSVLISYLILEFVSTYSEKLPEMLFRGIFET
jgi:hypothetical protein